MSWEVHSSMASQANLSTTLQFYRPTKSLCKLFGDTYRKSKTNTHLTPVSIGQVYNQTGAGHARRCVRHSAFGSDG